MNELVRKNETIEEGSDLITTKSDKENLLTTTKEIFVTKNIKSGTDSVKKTLNKGN